MCMLRTINYVLKKNNNWPFKPSFLYLCCNLILPSSQWQILSCWLKKDKVMNSIITYFNHNEEDLRIDYTMHFFHQDCK